MHQMWRLSEAVPQNLGLACTDDGLLLGRTFLIERRDGRFVVRARGEIERLLKCAYDGEPPVDRLMSGLARVASALNANDQCFGADRRGSFADARSGECRGPRRAGG
jgi:hypothetical protein